MGKNSFANKLSWSIIGIVSVIYLAALVIIAVIFYQLMTDEATHLSQESLAHASRMYFNLIVVGLLGLVVIFFVCRHVIKTKTRPVTEELETTSIANERMESELKMSSSGMKNHPGRIRSYRQCFREPKARFESRDMPDFRFRL